jgi:hypothetical protein
MDASSTLSSQATVAVVVSFAIQWLKKSPWFPWLTVETQKLNRWVAVVVAAATGFGIYATWTNGALTITGLTPANLWHAATHVVEQWTFQHAAYRTLIAPPLPGAVQAQQREQTTHVS